MSNEKINTTRAKVETTVNQLVDAVRNEVVKAYKQEVKSLVADLKAQGQKDTAAVVAKRFADVEASL